MSGEQISCEREKEVIWDEVGRCRNPDTQGWELFQAGLFEETRMLKECRESLVCMKCTWTTILLFDYYFYFFYPCCLPCCSSGLNSRFPHLAISTIVQCFLLNRSMGNDPCLGGRGGRSLVKMSLSILDLIQRRGRVN